LSEKTVSATNQLYVTAVTDPIIPPAGLYPG